MWECQLCEIKKNIPNREELEQEARQQNIIIRDALFGARTEGFTQYRKCAEDENIFYYDVASLSPAVNALDDYVVGFSGYRKITEKDILDDSFFGVCEVDVTLPNDSHVPVLPDNSDGKLLFA